MLFQGRLKGAVALYNMKFNDYQMDVKRDYLQGLANQIAIFLENARLYGMVIRDRLTGLYVHSFIEAEMENLIAQAKRYKFPICFIMLDVDKFKQVNDQFGHPAGNKLLKALADTIRSVSRDSDLVGRFGGDEFEILLPHTDKDGGLVYTDKLRKAVEKMEIEVIQGVKVRVTISIGLATYPKDSETVAQLQAAADSALYGAKALGRNCVVLYETMK
jgi:diguanylate cyclase (GGDEF)-like protein